MSRKFQMGDAWIKQEVPTWALPFIVNGDASGLTDSEIEMVRAWMDWWGGRACESWHVSVPDESPHFVSSPAFGLACDCVTCKVVMMNSWLMVGSK